MWLSIVAIMIDEILLHGFRCIFWKQFRNIEHVGNEKLTVGLVRIIGDIFSSKYFLLLFLLIIGKIIYIFFLLKVWRKRKIAWNLSEWNNEFFHLLHCLRIVFYKMNFVGWEYFSKIYLCLKFNLWTNLLIFIQIIHSFIFKIYLPNVIDISYDFY